MNELERVRRIAQLKIRLNLHKKRLSKLYLIQEGFDPFAPQFHGSNPLTGVPVTIIFNEPAPGRTSVMNWNPLLKRWMFSEDAGLRWQPVEFADYIEKVDCLMSEPKYEAEAE